MAEHPTLGAVLITGVYGSGKSSVGEEMAGVLEAADRPFALVDLDYLGWFYSGRGDEDRVALANLRAVIGNYLSAGVELFVVAGSVRDSEEFDRIRQALGMPVRVVRLVVPAKEIERRLRAAPTTARSGEDLPVAARWLAESTGEGLEDVAVAADRPPEEVAGDILRWLGWS